MAVVSMGGMSVAISPVVAVLEWVAASVPWVVSAAASVSVLAACVALVMVRAGGVVWCVRVAVSCDGAAML